jgi:uncharacterized membrane protein YfcA
MDILTIVLYFITCTGASFIQSVSGFGFGIVFMSFTPFFLPSYITALTTSNALSVATTTSTSFRLRKNAVWKQAFILFIGSSIVSSVTIALSKNQSDTFLTKLLGGFLILMSLYFIFFNNKFTIKPSLKNGLIAGVISGLLSGLFGTGGPPAVVYLMAVSKDKEEYLGTIQAYFALSGIYTLFFRFLNGMINKDVLILFVMGIIAVIIGMFIGGKTVKKLNGNAFRRLVYAVMAVSGIIMLIR